MNAIPTLEDIAVVGIGNLLMGDDGFGVHLVEVLEREDLLPGIKVWDFGTSPLDMLGVLLDNEKVIVIDAVRAGRAPGTVYRLTEDVLGDMPEDRLSSHDTRLLDTIAMARMLGSAPEVVVYGVEPERITPSIELSDSVNAALPDVARLVTEEVQRGRLSSEDEPRTMSWLRSLQGGHS